MFRPQLMTKFDLLLNDTIQNIDTSKWLDDYGDLMYSYAYTRVNDADLAKDLVQETLIGGLKGLDNFCFF